MGENKNITDYQNFKKALKDGREKSLLIVEFGDNDFGYDIKDALDSLHADTENIYNHSTDAIKEYIIAHVIGKNRKRAALRKDSFVESDFQKYLNDIQVTFRRTLPRNEPDGDFIDHDGGSAGIDLANGYSFTF